MTVPRPADATPLARVINLALSLRLIIAFAVLGMAAGAVLMIWEGSLEIRDAVLQTWSGAGPHSSVIADVMEATDKFLFGLVLVIFSFAVTFGFLIEVTPATRAQLPRWIAVDGIGELKHVFFEVILVYLAVDFVTNIASNDDPKAWNELVVPIAIFLLAGAIRLLVGSRGTHDA